MQKPRTRRHLREADKEACSAESREDHQGLAPQEDDVDKEFDFQASSDEAVQLISTCRTQEALQDSKPLYAGGWHRQQKKCSS